jgi:hypothetical protein
VLAPKRLDPLFPGGIILINDHSQDPPALRGPAGEHRNRRRKDRRPAACVAVRGRGDASGDALHDVQTVLICQRLELGTVGAVSWSIWLRMRTWAIAVRMSANDPKRTRAVAIPHRGSGSMSASPPKLKLALRRPVVSRGPKTDAGSGGAGGYQSDRHRHVVACAIEMLLTDGFRDCV